ncbi:MAG: hypothetical protein HY332_10815 [Chloroflexi bacterium]|nr:hypothetical protein [Chloroflexota bacterium]
MADSTRSVVRCRLATGPFEARLLADLEQLIIPVLSLVRHHCCWRWTSARQRDAR